MEYGLSAKDKAALRKAAHTLGADIRTKIQDVGGLTHFVVATTTPTGETAVLAKSRNLKQSHALLFGKWIVGASWIRASIAAGTWVDEAPHEVLGDAKVTQFVAGGPERARLSHAKEQGSIFKDTTFFISPSALRKGMKLHDFEHLLRLADARIFPMSSLEAVTAATAAAVAASEEGSSSSSSTTTTTTSATSTNVVISDKNRLDRKAREPVENGLAIAVTEDWAHDSVSNFMLMGTGMYEVELRRNGRSSRRR
jgi:hypothetical protein